MPDQRKHRGPHPDDERLFGDDKVTSLQRATHDLSWLLTRGYAQPSALKIVGDRFSLDARQRRAISRCACTDFQDASRRRSLVELASVSGGELWVDGYNALTSIEAALSGGVILRARDSCYRDMASMHGSYRRVEETAPALQLLARVIQHSGVKECRWLFDQPVSNSGRLKAMVEAMSDENEWGWTVELVPDPDPILIGCAHIVATADSQILDGARAWTNLVPTVIDRLIPESWIVDLGECAEFTM